MQHLDAIKGRLRAELPDKGISHVLKTLEGVLPSNSPKYDLLIALKSDYKKLKLEILNDLLSKEEENRQQANLRQRVLDFLRGLEPADFDKKTRRSYLAPEQKIKKGHVLYRIPKEMQLKQESRCLVRIAFDKEMIVEDLDIDEDTELRSGIRISDYMKVEIVDPSPDSVFDIRTTSESVQLIDADDFTEWKFYITPTKPGKHLLELKVKIMLKVDGEIRVREKTLEESVVISSGPPAALQENPYYWDDINEEIFIYSYSQKNTMTNSSQIKKRSMIISFVMAFALVVLANLPWLIFPDPVPGSEGILVNLGLPDQIEYNENDDSTVTVEDVLVEDTQELTGLETARKRDAEFNEGPNSDMLRGSAQVKGGLSNRDVVYMHTPQSDSELRGIIVVKVCVEKTGDVTYAEFTQWGSTVTSPRMKNLAVQSAKRWKFEAESIDKQCGTITYNF